ncbi:MAG: hypothetical protein HY308_12680 [Gammaproteobacteria bacterium]|nr:hypothetical protein [Gammaproteobacteria bacterium]
MAIPFLSEIERLITEHGSAAILKERIALANDKYTALEQKLSVCDAANKGLRSEIETLRLDNGKLKERVMALEEVLSDKKQKLLLEEQQLVDSLNSGIASDD